MRSFHVIVKFNVDPEQMESLKTVVKDFFLSDVQSATGFISSKFHINEEQSIFINYATWASLSDYENFMKDVASKSDKAKKVLSFKPSSDQVFHIDI